MNAPKPSKSLAGQKCPICNKGTFGLVQADHSENVSEDNPILVKNIWLDQCDHCGEIIFPGETTHYIESVIAEQTEQLTPGELERIREDLGDLTQDEISEIMGLGIKTYHKWESGSQYPTRSMCYYIRILAEFPQIFDWLRQRSWRKSNRIIEPQTDTDWNSMFPDLLSSYAVKSGYLHFAQGQSSQKRVNPALGLNRVVLMQE